MLVSFEKYPNNSGLSYEIVHWHPMNRWIRHRVCGKQASS